RPVRIVVGYPAGTSPELVSRIGGVEISKRLGQPVVVETRPGASGRIAELFVARSAPDGYNVLIDSPVLSADPLFTKTDTLVIGKDMVPLGTASRTSLVLLVRTSLGIQTFQELVAYAKKNPGKLNYGSIAVHFDLMMEMIKAKSGLNYTSVSYKGGVTA